MTYPSEVTVNVVDVLGNQVESAEIRIYSSLTNRIITNGLLNTNGEIITFDLNPGNPLGLGVLAWLSVPVALILAAASGITFLLQSWRHKESRV